MPLVRISLLAGKPESHKLKVSDAVHRALVETISIPAQDRFHVITEHDPADFIYDPEYLNVRRTKDLVIIQITLSAGRTLEDQPSPRKRSLPSLNTSGPGRHFRQGRHCARPLRRRGSPSTQFGKFKSCVGLSDPRLVQPCPVSWVR